MRALSLFNTGDVRNIEVSKPPMITGNLLLQIDMVSLCGTDLDSFRGKPYRGDEEVDNTQRVKLRRPILDPISPPISAPTGAIPVKHRRMVVFIRRGTRPR